MKAFKKLAVVGASLALLTACGGGNESGGGQSDAKCGTEGVYCVGMVTDGGKIDDKSFNQSTWDGLQAAAKADSSIHVKFIETVSATDYDANIKKFVDGKYDAVVTVGFHLEQPTLEAAKANPNVKFIGVDQSVAAANLPNLTGLIFPEDQAGYAAGYLAGRLTQSGTVGQVLGMEIPPVKKFAEGFIAGAKAAKPGVEVKTVYHPAGDNAFADPTWGAAEAQKQLDQKVDVIFGAGGTTGNGALGQIAKHANAGTSVYCIGVDSDQWETVPEARKCLVTSAMKNITEGTTELTKQAKAGTIKGGDVVGKTGLAPYHDFESKLPAEVKTDVQKVVDGLQDGTIKTGVKLS